MSTARRTLQLKSRPKYRIAISWRDPLPKPQIAAMVPISTAFSPDSRWGITRQQVSNAPHVAVEINANPYRLDLDWRWHEERSPWAAC
jgi:hypothetical protein